MSAGAVVSSAPGWRSRCRSTRLLSSSPNAHSCAQKVFPSLADQLRRNQQRFLRRLEVQRPAQGIRTMLAQQGKRCQAFIVRVGRLSQPYRRQPQHLAACRLVVQQPGQQMQRGQPICWLIDDAQTRSGGSQAASGCSLRLAGLALKPSAPARTRYPAHPAGAASARRNPGRSAPAYPAPAGADPGLRDLAVSQLSQLS